WTGNEHRRVSEHPGLRTTGDISPDKLEANAVFCSFLARPPALAGRSRRVSQRARIRSTRRANSRGGRTANSLVNLRDLGPAPSRQHNGRRSTYTNGYPFSSNDLSVPTAPATRQ